MKNYDWLVWIKNDAQMIFGQPAETSVHMEGPDITDVLIKARVKYEFGDWDGWEVVTVQQQKEIDTEEKE